MVLTQEYINERFIKACKARNVDMVEYYLTSPDLNIHADITIPVYHQDDVLMFAIRKQMSELAQLILFSSELKQELPLVVIDGGNNVYAQMAAFWGSFDCLKLLLQKGIDMFNRKECYLLLGNSSFVKNKIQMMEFLLSADCSYAFFEETPFNFDNALKNYNQLIIPMLTIFYNTDPVTYLQKKEKYHQWCLSKNIMPKEHNPADIVIQNEVPLYM